MLFGPMMFDTDTDTDKNTTDILYLNRRIQRLELALEALENYIHIKQELIPAEPAKLIYKKVKTK